MNGYTVLTLLCICIYRVRTTEQSVNMDKTKGIYIGQIIQEKVIERGLGYSEFARRINCARSSLYHIFNSKSIDIEKLILISDVLEYDFITEIYLQNKLISNFNTHIQIPLIDGKIDLSNLPKEVIALIKKQISET